MVRLKRPASQSFLNCGEKVLHGETSQLLVYNPAHPLPTSVATPLQGILKNGLRVSCHGSDSGQPPVALFSKVWILHSTESVSYSHTVEGKLRGTC